MTRLRAVRFGAAGPSLRARLLVVVATIAASGGAAIVAGGLQASAEAFAPAAPPARQDGAPQTRQAAGGPSFDNVEITVRKVQGNVYLLASGVGGNTTVQVGDTGVLVVDPGYPQLNEKLVAAIRTISPKAIHYILNTHVHEDHAGGNERLAQVGPQRPNANPLTAGVGGNTGGATTIVAHESVYHRMSAAGADHKPGAAWPNDTFFNELREIYFNDDGIQMFHVPSAHTDGDSIVYFRRSDVIATGDLFTTTMYPYIDVARGGHVDGIIAGLNTIIDLALPNLTVQEGGTMIIPGHGRICDEQDVIEYRDMLTIVRDRIQAMVDRKMTLDQVKAARPTLDWDARYGSDTGFWTTPMFVETIYRNLSEPTGAR
jgi:glyoxylase-like metal-dependent hydrolase (beta-lactamase superfamily II)